MKKSPKWLIWSNEHEAWWRSNEKGYVNIRSKAGRYDFEKAKDICKGANMFLKDTDEPNETMVQDE